MTGHPETQYRDSTLLTQWTLWLLYAQIAITAAALWTGSLERSLLLDMQAGAFESNEAMMAAASTLRRVVSSVSLGSLARFQSSSTGATRSVAITFESAVRSNAALGLYIGSRPISGRTNAGIPSAKIVGMANEMAA